MRSYNEEEGEEVVKCSHCNICIIYSPKDLYKVDYVDENTGVHGSVFGLSCPKCTRVYSCGELRYITKYKKRSFWQKLKELFK